MNQSFDFDKSAYERPTQTWICGWVSDGESACPQGPDQKGRCCALDPCRPVRRNDQWICGWSVEGGRTCLSGPDQNGNCCVAQMDRPVTFTCKPVRRNDRWLCTRSKNDGGPCAQGPLPTGICCTPIPRCQPDRSLLSKRNLVTRLVTAFSIGILLILLTGPTRLNNDLQRAFISPGDLTTHHAILDCSACHTAAGSDEQTAGLLATMLTFESGQDEMMRCISCHTPEEGFGLKDHSLSSEELASRKSETEAQTPFFWSMAALGPDVPRSASGELACVACHKEHQGRSFEINHMDNQRCQTCHMNQFSGFDDGHPGFSDYPHAWRRQWNFDHGKHKNEHFATKNTSYECASCHVPDTEGQNILVSNFEAICSDCHSIELEQQGISFLLSKEEEVSPRWKFSHEAHQGHFIESEITFSCSGCHMPSPDVKNMLIGNFEVTCATGCHHHVQQIRRSDEIEIFSLPYLDVEGLGHRGIGQWPEDAAGEITPYMKLLMSANPSIADDLQLLSETDIYLDDLSEADEASIAAAARVIWAIKTLIYDMITQDRKEHWRLDQEDSAWFEDRDRASLAEQLPIDAIRAAQSRWLPELESEVRRYRRGEQVETTPFYVDMEALEKTVQPAGWSFEASEFTARYQPTGHADSILRRWLDITGRMYNKSGAAEEIFDQLEGPFASGRCMTCHSVDGPEGQKETITQNEFRKIDWPEAPLPFTRFTHRPHMDQACSDCHQGEGFAPIEMAKATCAKCHTSDRAGDTCLTCHSYHMGRFFLARTEDR